jgi:hypothetical protein
LTLLPDRLVVTRNGEKTETAIAGRREWEDALREHFGVTL